MLKILRKGAIENVWFYRIIMIVLSLAFVITMGWWGFGGPSEQHVVAKVGKTSITLEQYQQAYERVYKSYREIFKDQFNEDLVKQLNLKKTIIDGLVDRQLWLLAARQMGIEVSDQELSDFILKQQAFQREGRFDPEMYKRIVSRIGYTPEAFERIQRDDLLVEKVRSILKASVTVTDIESQELQAQPASSQPATPSTQQEQLQGLLMHKQELALEAYLNSLKSQVPIFIDEKML
ncbi:MAG: SurA N-terminal domain-containing protein [Nitrospira sp.]|nr:SurA N-terminal domain-containing protein [Nitrospira sp.]